MTLAPGHPLHLDPARAAAVESTLSALSVRELAGQLMCVYLFGENASGLIEELDGYGLRPGGVLLSTLRSRAQARADVAALQAGGTSLLVAANLEAGTATFLTDGESFANPLQVAATRDVEHARRLGAFCAARGREAGVNWAFGPVVDVLMNPRNPIVSTRAFSSEVELTASLGAAFVRAVQAGGVAASPKHWPGDGVDDRDQHLVTSVNSLSMAEWEASFGAVYRAMVGAGAMTVMAGHITLPAYGPRDRAHLPGSLSEPLLTDLLRGEFGFEGMVVSDNNLMAGFTRVMPRRLALPAAINAGCDMLLGARFVQEDFEILVAAAESGEIPASRLTDAVRRVLTVKAALGLLDATPPESPESPEFPASVEEFDTWKTELARDSVTLTKQTDDVLPVTAERYPRVLVYVLGDTGTFYEPAHGLAERFVEGLRDRGMDVTRRDVPGEDRNQVTEREVQEKHDLTVYFANYPFDSVANVSRIRWSYPQGPEAPRRPETTSLLVSVADPYHLRDVPSIGTAVNGYTPSPQTVDAVLACLAGEAEFRGVSPVDPTGGYPDALLPAP